MNFSLLLYIFAIPFSNYIEFFDILKNHGDLLTILFCICIIGSSYISLDPTVTGIMSGILAIMILFKVLNSSK